MADQLGSWKEIAAYVGREVRTVQRWAATRGLPVRRLPGSERPRVFAFTGEIDAWLRAGSADLTLAQAPAPLAVLPFPTLTTTPPGVLGPPTGDLVAHQLWMKGRSSSQDYTPDAYAQARECYEAAIARAPGFARAHFALAELLFYGVEFGLSKSPGDVPRAREALARSLDCDKLIGEAHALLGVFQGLLEYDWPAAERSFARAFALSPGSSAILSQHAWYHLVPRLRLEEAVNEAQQAVALDPLSPFVRGHLSLTLQAAGQYSRAADECRRALELAPRLWWLRWFYGTGLLLQGRHQPGFRHCQLVYDRNPRPTVAGAMALVCGLFGRRERAMRLLTELQQTAERTYVAPCALAWAYLGLGDDRAFEWLDKAIDARDPVVTHLPSMPFYDGIRRDQRFRALLEKMRLA